MIDSNTNCDIFISSGSSYICDGCPSTSYSLVALKVDAGSNALAKGCAQILIPNAIVYKNTLIYDANGYIYLTSSQCSNSVSIPAGPNTLFIPSYSVATKDSSGIACT